MVNNRNPLDPDTDLRGGDEGDRGNAQAEQNLAIAIRQARSMVGPKPTGLCAYCEEPVAEGARFCEVDVLERLEYSCIRSWEALQNRTRPRRVEEAIIWTPDEPEEEL
jgi:hypothetical protein